MSSDTVYTQREIDNLINLLSDARTENMRLRAALEKINVGEGWAALIARAALEDK